MCGLIQVQGLWNYLQVEWLWQCRWIIFIIFWKCHLFPTVQFCVRISLLLGGGADRDREREEQNFIASFFSTVFVLSL